VNFLSKVVHKLSAWEREFLEKSGLATGVPENLPTSRMEPATRRDSSSEPEVILWFL
jgi:hypothetical protein